MPNVRLAERPRRGHEVLLAYGEHGRAHDPGIDRDGHDADREQRVDQARRRPVTMAIASSSAGKARSTSMSRIRPLSVRPPTRAGEGADRDPIDDRQPTVAKPTRSEIRAPWTTRLYTSRTLPSRPNKCSGWSAGQPRRWMHGAARSSRRRSTPSSSLVRVVGRDHVGEEGDEHEEAEDARPTTAERWRRMLRSVSRHSAGGSAPAGPCPVASGSTSRRSRTLVAHRGRTRGSRKP